MLRTDALLAMLDFQERAAAIEVQTTGSAASLGCGTDPDARCDEAVIGGEALARRTWGLADLCLMPTGVECVVATPLDYWSGVNGPSNPPDTRANLLANNCDRTQDDYEKEGFCSGDLGFSASIPYAKSNLGAGLVRKNLLGGVALRENEFPDDLYADEIVASARAAMITFLLDVGGRSEAHQEAAEAWELAFEAVAEDFATSEVAIEAGLSAHYNAQRSLTDEVEEAAHADAAFVAISYSLVLAYACVGTATRAAPLRLLVGAAGVALTALATLAALGLTALAGVPVTPMTAQVSAYAAPDSSP